MAAVVSSGRGSSVSAQLVSAGASAAVVAEGPLSATPSFSSRLVDYGVQIKLGVSRWSVRGCWGWFPSPFSRSL
jgi:hypothetical protein